MKTPKTLRQNCFENFDNSFSCKNFCGAGKNPVSSPVLEANDLPKSPCQSVTQQGGLSFPLISFVFFARCLCYLLDSRTGGASFGWVGLQELQCAGSGEICPLAGRDQFSDQCYCLLLPGQ